jgi:hypothetical protein
MEVAGANPDESGRCCFSMHWDPRLVAVRKDSAVAQLSLG